MQHIPIVEASDVARVIRRDFGEGAFAEVVGILAEYGGKDFHREVDRVRLDILKLAEGDLGRLRQELENACCDFRDVVAAAEYPNYMKKVFCVEELGSEKVAQIVEADRQQYEAWLRKV